MKFETHFMKSYSTISPKWGVGTVVHRCHGCEKTFRSEQSVRFHECVKTFKTRATEIIAKLTYKPDWTFLLEQDKVAGGRLYIQISAKTPDSMSKSTKKVPWRSAKHYLSEHMCDNEIVSTAFHAVQQAEEHEMKEFFKFHGVRIFNPHADPFKLVEFMAKEENINLRVNPMTMAEVAAV